MMLRKVLAVVVAMVLGAGIAAAQAPDFEEGIKRPAQMPVARKMVVAYGGPNALLAVPGGDVAIANVDGGVELTITAEEPEDVAQLQQRMEKIVESIQRMATKAARAREEMKVQPGQFAGNIWGVFLSGQVEITCARIDDGVVVSLVSHNEEVLKNMQDNMARWSELAQDAQQRREKMMRLYKLRQEAQALIADGKVTLEFEQTDDGLTVRFVSDDPALAEKLQELLPEYFDGIKEQQAPNWPAGAVQVAPKPAVKE